MKLKYNENIEIKTFNTLNDIEDPISIYLQPGNIGLSGGSTYLELLRILSKKDIDLKDINFFPVDERIIDFNSNESNWGNTYRNFLSKFNTTIENYFQDSKEYNKVLEGIKFDTIFLGVGDDGHTASLFDSKAVYRNDNLNAVETISPKAPFKRISLTGNCIKQAKNVVIIILGNGKKEIFNKILENTDLPITILLRELNNGVIYVQKSLVGVKHE
ncbi:MAG: 6-phosphogluconolactonase [Spirochaetales bacterium]|nr:6-phosphogluconolactonase [Spirochaetales bacterium]